jgi:hypothetical protein
MLVASVVWASCLSLVVPLFPAAVDGQALDGNPAPKTPASLYILDMEGDGISLTSAAEGVDFDIDGSGRRTRVAWTRAGSDDAFLGLDVNRNGAIDSIRELVSTHTTLPQGRTVTTAADVLNVLQGMVRGPDGRLPTPLPVGAATFDSEDSAFGTLLVWVDGDHDGRSSPSELRSLEAAEVAAVYGGFRRSQEVDANGNRTLLNGTFWLNRRGVRLQRAIQVVILAGTTGGA